MPGRGGGVELHVGKTDNITHAEPEVYSSEARERAYDLVVELFIYCMYTYTYIEYDQRINYKQFTAHIHSIGLFSISPD